LGGEPWTSVSGSLSVWTRTRTTASWPIRRELECGHARWDVNAVPQRPVHDMVRRIRTEFRQGARCPAPPESHEVSEAKKSVEQVRRGEGASTSRWPRRGAGRGRSARTMGDSERLLRSAGAGRLTGALFCKGAWSQASIGAPGGQTRFLSRTALAFSVHRRAPRFTQLPLRRAAAPAPR